MDEAYDLPEAEEFDDLLPRPVAPRRGNPRKTFTIIAVVLAVILIALLIYLLFFLGRPRSLAKSPARGGVQPIWAVYGPGTGATPLFKRPMGVAVGEHGRIYVTDSGNDRVCVFAPSGRFLFQFGSFGVAKPIAGVKSTYRLGCLNFPVGIATDSDGNVYVASFYNDCIEVFDANGTPLRRFPDPRMQVGKGSSGQDGGGIAVTAVAVHGDHVYATDQYQVFVFTRAGRFVRQWGMPGVKPADLDHPNGIDVGSDGTVYVSDSNHARVTAFTPSGTPKWTYGADLASLAATDSAQTTEQPIELPRGLTVQRDGSVLVTDAFRFDIVRLSATGKLLGTYGIRGVDPGEFDFLNDVAIYRGYVVVADKENGRIQMVKLLE